MPTGLLVLCLVTVPLAAVLLVVGQRLKRRSSPLDVPIRTPGGGIISDPQAKLLATHRIGRSAQWLGTGLLVLTVVMIVQDWRAGRLSAAQPVCHMGANCDKLRLAGVADLGLLRIIRKQQGIEFNA